MPVGDAGWTYLHDLDAQNRHVDSSGLTGVNAAAAQYPAFAALMNIPEVADLLNQAAKEGWSNDQMTLHLMTTHWWKSKSDTERIWEATKLSDPAKAGQQKQQMNQQVASMASLLGVSLDLHQIDFISEGAIAGGWSADILKSAIAGNAQFSKDNPGSISSTQTTLQGIAASYGVPISDQTTFDWAKKVAMGQSDPASFKEWAKNQAKLEFPTWAKQLDEGVTVRQLADPYIQDASQLLEISPDQIDLTDAKWQKALHQKDAQGQNVGPMSRTDWKRTIMEDPTYGYQQTDNAKQAAFSMVDMLKKTFGMSA